MYFCTLKLKIEKNKPFIYPTTLPLDIVQFLNPKGCPTLLKTDWLIGDKTPKQAIELTTKIVFALLQISPKLNIAVLTKQIATVKVLQKTMANNHKHLLVETVDRIQGLTTDITIFIIPNTSLTYLPFITKQLENPISLSFLLKYYFPNIVGTIHFQNNIHSAFQTDIISHSVFSRLGYNDQINPGFFRYIGKDIENLFVYEYFPFVGSHKSSILKQIDYYISSLFENQKIESILSINEEEVFFDDMFRESEILDIEIEEDQEKPFPKDFFEKEIKPQGLINISYLFKEQVLEKKAESDSKEKKTIDDSSRPNYHKKKASTSFSRKMESFSHSLFDDEEEQSATHLPSVLPKKGKAFKEKSYSKEHELISQIKSDIQNLKELGFYELLIKELRSVLFEQDAKKIFQPSRLFMDEEFRIYLPNFNNLEIVMTPLPKTLFILFLRHPDGIYLKSLLDYKKELLEIYKLLSYRETHFDMIESVNRICNPFEGSINEKLSRIKEAFLKKISMDTAKYYIVAGERGMKKKIEIDRSLIDLPDTFNEIELTEVFE
jgi:hypothetical protein